jgi:peptide/nickel transport system substrate-binding protein
MTDAAHLIGGSVIKRRMLLAGSAGVALAASAEIGGFPASAQAAETPKRGGKLVMARNGDVVSFEPVVPSDNMSIWAKLLIFQMLVRTNPAGDGVVPDLADKWEISSDKRTYTFHIRDNSKFSDGSPVTAEDVMFSIDRSMNDKDSPWNTLYPKLTMEAPEPQTVVFKLEQDYAPFMAVASLHGGCVVPKAYFNKLGVKAFGEKPMGSGPFMMTEWKKGQSITFDRNPHFWDPTRPYLDQVVLSVITDDNTRMLQVESGAIDIATFVPFSQIARMKRASGIDVQVSPYDRVDWFQFNEKLPLFQDAKIRQAMNYAVDKQAIIKSVLFGFGEVPSSFLPKMFMADLAQAPYAHDLAKAKQLMAESTQPNGFDAVLKIDAGDAVVSQVAQIVQQMVLPLKIKLTIQSIEPDTLFSQQQNADYQISWGYMTSDILDPSELVAFAVQSDGGSNSVYTWYKNPEVDKLAHDGLGELDPDKRTAIYKHMQQLVFADAPLLWLYWTPAITALRQDVHGFRVLPTGNYWLEDVWKS